MTWLPILILTVFTGFLGSGCVSPNHFSLKEIAPGIYEGCKPTTPAQFELLRAHGIRTILSLQVCSWDILPERQRARKHGLMYVNVPILPSPLPPSDKQMQQALLALDDPALRPIYIHCLLGEDRTTMLFGMYRVYFQGWAPENAWQEMIRDGFHVRWSLKGFETYFWHHTQPPEWAKAAMRARAQLSHAPPSPEGSTMSGNSTNAEAIPQRMAGAPGGQLANVPGQP